MGKSLHQVNKRPEAVVAHLVFFFEVRSLKVDSYIIATLYFGYSTVRTQCPYPPINSGEFSQASFPAGGTLGDVSQASFPAGGTLGVFSHGSFPAGGTLGDVSHASFPAGGTLGDVSHASFPAGGTLGKLPVIPFLPGEAFIT